MKKNPIQSRKIEKREKQHFLKKDIKIEATLFHYISMDHMVPEKHFPAINKLELSYGYTSRLGKSHYCLPFRKDLVVFKNILEFPLLKGVL